MHEMGIKQLNIQPGAWFRRKTEEMYSGSENEDSKDSEDEDQSQGLAKKIAIRRDVLGMEHATVTWII